MLRRWQWRALSPLPRYIYLVFQSPINNQAMFNSIMDLRKGLANLARGKSSRAKAKAAAEHGTQAASKTQARTPAPGRHRPQGITPTQTHRARPSNANSQSRVTGKNPTAGSTQRSQIPPGIDTRWWSCMIWRQGRWTIFRVSWMNFISAVSSSRTTCRPTVCRCVSANCNGSHMKSPR